MAWQTWVSHVQISWSGGDKARDREDSRDKLETGAGAKHKGGQSGAHPDSWGYTTGWSASSSDSSGYSWETLGSTLQQGHQPLRIVHHCSLLPPSSLQTDPWWYCTCSSCHAAQFCQGMPAPHSPCMRQDWAHATSALRQVHPGMPECADCLGVPCLDSWDCKPGSSGCTTDWLGCRPG